MLVVKSISENTERLHQVCPYLPPERWRGYAARDMLCMKTLSHSCLTPFQLKQHLNNAHIGPS